MMQQRCFTDAPEGNPPEHFKFRTSKRTLNNKNMSLNVLKSWCEIRQCTLEELSPELAKIVSSLKEKETFESSKQIFASLGF